MTALYKEHSLNKIDERKWVRIYSYELNNGRHWAYTEPESRVFRSQFVDVIEIGGIQFGTFEEVILKRVKVEKYSIHDLEFYSANATLKEKTGDTRFITVNDFYKSCRQYEKEIKLLSDAQKN